MKARLHTHCCNGQAISNYTFWVCVFSLRYSACRAMRHIRSMFWSVAYPTTPYLPTLSDKQHDFRRWGWGFTEYTRVLIFSKNVFQPLRTVRPIYRTGAPLTSKCCILYIFSTNINTEYFKHAAHSGFFSSKSRLFRNATFFGSCIIHLLHRGCAKI